MTDLRRAHAELERGVARGWHTAAQLFAWLDGRTVADLALGEARPGVPMTPTTLVEWASATKPVTCAAAALLWQRGLLDLDDPVCRHVPEFGQAGKERVTVRHLMTHTAGLTDPVRDVVPFDQAIAAVCAAPLKEGWVPGARCAYNSVGMWALAALVERLSGQRFARFVRAEIFEPLGLRDSWIGMPVGTYRAYGEGRFAAVPGHPETGTEAWVTWGRPTGGGYGPIRELGLFYAALLEPRLLAPPVIEAMTTRHLCGAYDELMRATVDRGLGFMLGSSYAGHGFGPHASRRAFGHGGRNWCQALADPEHRLAVAVYWNGRLDGDALAERQTGLFSALYEDLALSRAG